MDIERPNTAHSSDCAPALAPAQTGSLPAAPPGAKARKWLTQYERFVPLWSTRVDDSIPDSHSMSYWVQRQRSRHHQGKLEAWKIARLEAIGFTFVGARDAAVPTNEGYAARLVAFYEAHGHYSPTVQVGGSGLTRWCRLMRESDGAKGIIGARPGVDESQDLSAARALLEREIPGFMWSMTEKASANAACGLTRNAYIPHSPTPKPPSPRRQEAMERARASLAHPPLARFAPGLPPGFVQRLIRSGQACRCRIYPAGTSEAQIADEARPARTGWVHEVLYSCGSDARFVIYTGPATTASDGCTLERKRLVNWQFCFQWELVTVELTDGAVAAFDYDCYLDDQLESIVPDTGRVAGLYEPDWHCAAVGDFTGRLASRHTTANIWFERDIRRLLQYLNAHTDPADRDIRLTNDKGMVFRFLEHQVLKMQRAALPRSHSLLLCSMPTFTFGERRQPNGTLFAPARSGRASERTQREIEAEQASRRKWAPPYGSIVHRAAATLEEFACRARARALDVMVQPEEGCYYFRRAKVLDGMLHVTYTSKRTPFGRVYGTMLSADDLRACSIGVNSGLSGVDFDGEPIRVYAQ